MRVLAGWTILVLVGWFVVGAIAEHDASACRAQGDLVGLCGDPGSSLLFLGLPAAAVWVVGAIIILAAVAGRKR